MNDDHPGLSRAAAPRPPWRTLAALAVLHALMFVYDLRNPDVLIHADRAGNRLRMAQEFAGALRGGDWADFLASHGNPGDYALHALLWMGGGVPAILLAQIALVLASGLAVWRVGVLMGLSPRVAHLACAAYLLLPHTLIFSHQATSEAFHSPLLAFAAWGCAEAIHGRRGWRTAGVAGLASGVAALIRPVSMPWPALVGVTMLLTPGRRAAAWAHLVGAAVVVFAWFTFMASQTGHFGMGASQQDGGHNLFQRVRRISTTLPEEHARQVVARYLGPERQGVLGIPDYFAFILEQPAAFARHTARDLAMLGLKSGVERVFIDYFETNAESRPGMQDARSGWRHVLETQGIGAALATLWQAQGAVLLVALAGSAVMVAWLVAAATGMLRLLRGGVGLAPAQIRTGWIVFLLFVQLFLLTLAADAVLSRHRTPMEFPMVLLAALGVDGLRRRTAPH